MWLLDVNLPTGLLALLRGYSISCDTTANRGWRDLTNGLLAEAAFRAGFRVILTRDRLFGESASRALGGLPELAVVVVNCRRRAPPPTCPSSEHAGSSARSNPSPAASWSGRKMNVGPVCKSLVRA